MKILLVLMITVLSASSFAKQKTKKAQSKRAVSSEHAQLPQKLPSKKVEIVNNDQRSELEKALQEQSRPVHAQPVRREMRLADEILREPPL